MGFTLLNRTVSGWPEFYRTFLFPNSLGDFIEKLLDLLRLWLFYMKWWNSKIHALRSIDTLTDKYIRKRVCWLLVVDACLPIARFGIEEAGLRLRLLIAGLTIEPFWIDLDDRLEVSEIGLWLYLFKIEDAGGNFQLLKPRLCVDVLSDVCFTLAVEERFTIVVDLMEALGNQDVLRI